MPTPVALSAPRRRTSGVPANVLGRHAVEALLSKKGLDLRVIDVRGVSGVADFFVIGTGESELQVRAMVDAVREEILDETGERPWHIEGTDHHQWVVLDYVDLVVHVFHPERRAFYALERLWGDAPSETVPDDGTGESVALLRDDAPVPVPPTPPAEV